MKIDVFRQRISEIIKPLNAHFDEEQICQILIETVLVANSDIPEEEIPLVKEIIRQSIN